MGYIDIAISIILGVGFLWGVIRGLVRQVVAIIFLITGFFVAVRYTSALITTLPDSPLYNFHYAIWFFALFVVVILVGFFVNCLLSFAITATSLTAINRLLGGIFGVLKGVILSMIMLHGLQFTQIKCSPAWDMSFFIQIQQPIADRISMWLS